jgi:hypothetical protein
MHAMLISEINGTIPYVSSPPDNGSPPGLTGLI